MKTLISIIAIVVIYITTEIVSIFRMKYKKEMYIENLKHYEEGTSMLNDVILMKLFNIDKEEL